MRTKRAGVAESDKYSINPVKELIKTASKQDFYLYDYLGSPTHQLLVGD